MKAHRKRREARAPDGFGLVTAIFGDYDPIRSLPHGVRGVCYTDAPTVATGWKRRTLASDLSPRLKNRHVKTLAHRFVNANVVLYIDGHYQLMMEPAGWALDVLGDADFAAYAHPARDCVYAEGEMCLRERRGDPRAIEQQLERYRAAGMPKSSGLFGGGILVRRMVPSVKAFGEAWWAEIAAGSERDQLSLGFLAWKLQAQIRVIEGNLYRPPFAVHRGHPKRRPAHAR